MLELGIAPNTYVYNALMTCIRAEAQVVLSQPLSLSLPLTLTLTLTHSLSLAPSHPLTHSHSLSLSLSLPLYVLWNSHSNDSNPNH